MAKCCGNLLEGKESNIFNWIFTASFWIVTIHFLIFSKEVRIGIKNFDFENLINVDEFRGIIAFYSFYLICQLATTGFRKFIKIQNIRSVLKANIEKKFDIKYFGKSWHEEEDTDINGNSKKKTIVTFEKKIPYIFQSGADYSLININWDDINNKRYLDLEIEFVYIAVDKKTHEEERAAYDAFHREASRDESFLVKNYISMKNSHSKNIISSSNCFILILDRFIFIIFILLSLGQIYKYIISCFMTEKKIQVTKIISNYYDLTSTDSFFNIQPNVRLFGENIKYDRAKCAFKNSEGLELMICEKNPLNTNYLNHDSKSRIEISNQENIKFSNNNNIEDNEKNTNIDNNNLEMENLHYTKL